MAIIDLVSLCSPIHTFKRGLIFGQSTDSVTREQIIQSSMSKGQSETPAPPQFEHTSHVTYGKNFGIGSSNSTNKIGLGTVRGTVGEIGGFRLGILSQNMDSIPRFDPGINDIQSDLTKSDVRDGAVLLPQPQKIQGIGNLNLMKLTQNVQNYGIRYNFEGPNYCTLQKNTIAIFDLDDTLIPTDWIRETYSKIRQNPTLSYLFSSSNNNVYQYIRVQIDQQVNFQLIPNIIRIISHAKNTFLDVAIVTNARSTGWLKVIESMFPELTNALRELGIPIIRTNPEGNEPEIEEGERYFNYWMMAKKFEFEKIVRKWTKGESNTKIDLISIGDNDFEECAAIHLAIVDRAVRYSKIIRCGSGLSPKAFISQLQAISNAIEIERKRSSPHSWISYTNTVSSIIIDSSQTLSDSTNLYEESTEDE
ncbi:Trimeric LpxA-like [Cryptosporidium felis]|nr:Trimeric LpxA-like [Cryptosporidium felis]